MQRKLSKLLISTPLTPPCHLKHSLGLDMCQVDSVTYTQVSYDAMGFWDDLAVSLPNVHIPCPSPFNSIRAFHLFELRGQSPFT